MACCDTGVVIFTLILSVCNIYQGTETRNKQQSELLSEKRKRGCIFERLYFAADDHLFFIAPILFQNHGTLIYMNYQQFPCEHTSTIANGNFNT